MTLTATGRGAERRDHEKVRETVKEMRLSRVTGVVRPRV